MEALDRLIQQIIDDTKQETDRILAQAEETARHMKEKADRKLAEDADAYVQGREAAAAAASELRREETAQECAKRLLNEKRRLIEEMIAASKEALIGAPDEAYFASLTEVLTAYETGTEGQILLNPKDIRRMTKEFSDVCAKKSLVPTESERVENGFIIKRGDIEDNCTVDALLAEKRDVLFDRLNTVLFGTDAR